MPSRARMRSATLADISRLTALQRLVHLNLIGFGVSDVTPLGVMKLTALEVGLNPLTSDSLGAIGRIQSLQHLELGGESGWFHTHTRPVLLFCMPGATYALVFRIE